MICVTNDKSLSTLLDGTSDSFARVVNCNFWYNLTLVSHHMLANISTYAKVVYYVFFGSSHSRLSGISRSSNIYASMHAIDDSTTEELEKQTQEEVAVAFLCKVI